MIKKLLAVSVLVFLYLTYRTHRKRQALHKFTKEP